MSCNNRSTWVVFILAIACAQGLLAADVVVSNSAALRVAINAARPGDRILMAPGTYGDGLYVDGTSGGTASQPILIAAQNPLNPPVFNTPSGIMFDHVSNFVLDGLVVNSTALNSIQIAFGQNVVLKNIVSGQCNTGGSGTPVKFTGCTGFLLFRCSGTQYGGLGVNMVGSAKGLLMDNNFSDPSTPGAFCGFEAKGGSYNIGMLGNVLNQCGNRVLQMGGDTGPGYFHQGNLALGWENYDCVAMGNKIIAGKYPISYSNANNVRLEYNTIVNPQSALMRILSESVVATNPSSNGVYSHNLVVYGSVGEYVNESPSNINPGSFTFDGNYWYRTTNPAASRPPLPGTQINDAGGVDPQLSPSYDPQYEPAKAYGAGAPGLDAAWLPHVGKFQWAWNTVQTYLPQARPVVLAATGGVVLDASASAPGVNSYGSNTLQSYGWDIDNDGDVDLACTGTCALSNAQLRDQYGLLPGNHSVGLIVSVLTELGAVVVSKESMTTLTVAPMAGDANSDGVVDQADYTIWYNHYGQTPATWADGDVTGDNIVDQADYTVWYNHYGQTGSNVPEPMTMALLAIGGVAMLRRRKGSSLSFEGRTDPGPADRVRGRTLSIPKTPSGCQTVAE